MKKSKLDENKVYTSLEELKEAGSTRRKCKFICERCHKESTMAVDRILKKNKLVCHQCSKELTCIKNYGVPIPYQSSEVRKKGMETCLRKYGVEYSGQTEQARKKASELFKNPEFREKSKQACMAKFGVEYFSETEKFKKIMSDKFKDDDYVKKRTEMTEKTKFSKYGDKHYNNMEKYKNTCMEKYGCEYALLNKDIRSKAQQAFKNKYGVDNPGQMESHITSKKYKEDGYMFDSSWELKFYRYIKSKNFKFEFHPKISFEYYYNGIKHLYFPDFIVNDRFVEIKGNHFFNDIGWLINPFDRSQDELYRAKHECMLKNNVIILKYNDLKEILNERI